MDNLLQLEPELIARLKERLAAERPAVHVLGAADLAGVTEEQQLSPAVHVVYQRYRVANARSDGRVTRVVQTWLPVVAVRNARTPKTGAAGRSEAGELAGKVLQALLGWRPPSANTPLTLATAPAAGFSKTFQYLPLAVEAELVVKTNPNP